MTDKRESAGVYILGAGLLFFLIAASVVVFAPWVSQSERQRMIVDVDGQVITAPGYTDASNQGRKVYMRETCWLCHSQVVRAFRVIGEDGEEWISKGGDVERYGPRSQAGEAGTDMPHLYGTRRIGPDLARVGQKYADAWHLTHFLNPQAVVPGSIMPRFTWLYLDVKYDENNNPVSGVPSVELLDLISYIQGLGTGIGAWRGEAAVGGEEDAQSVTARFKPEDLVKKGKELFGKVGCTGCHGARGWGDGAAAANFPEEFKPRNFHDKSAFKYGWDAEDVRATISGGRSPYMPAHPQLKVEDVVSLAEYVRSLGEQ